MVLLISTQVSSMDYSPEHIRGHATLQWDHFLSGVIRALTLLSVFITLSVLISCEEASSPEGTSEMDSTPEAGGNAAEAVVPYLGERPLSSEERLDPTRCQGCHPEQYREWSASMHAYASVDPVFRAMNAKGQRETEGALGDFCVQCHAPLALRLGATQDGLNLDDLPEYLGGITCAFCHQVDAVEGTHNNPLRWTDDGVMRGGVRDSIPTTAHSSQHHPLFDRDDLRSSSLCGACHDIVTQNNIHLERGFLEWRESLFNDTNPRRRNTCNDCHMPSRLGAIAEGGPERRRHSHLSPGVDVALIDFPHREVLTEAVKGELRGLLLSEVCVILGVGGGAEVELYLENLAAGHRVPSGAALDRRFWVEITVSDAEGTPLFQSGVVDSSTPVSYQLERDPQLWILRDTAYDVEGEVTHDFWRIDRVERATLPAPTILLPTDSRYEEPHILHRYRFGSERPVAHVSIRVWARPIGLEVLQSLVESGDLSPEIIDQSPTFELTGAAREWVLEEAERRVTLTGREALCTPL